MNKQDLKRELANGTGISQMQAETVLDCLGKLVSEELAADGDVTLPGIGKLKVQARAGRTGRNPKTGEPVEISARTVVKFSAAKVLKDAVA